ncbi:hypothetical protein ODU75_10135 [Lactobacillus amylovorus]|uniref:Uncharacterized protein n=1 Tax=Lactobacillus amylovorus TaxID=1604 RepID=A0A9X3W824_LACAM|nr:hypothetical protein [Lactobacillus amylovorus]MDB6243622.1 hypothetical protein [Lactobacillus amylovorus]MDB6252141.1 hypothetical protein [Lactobacillus amylovorus]MDB6254969.1 hypothetical protein [Lactobacillus amylovorus]MDB6256039.1 hypothetical protein [Lactobacillus amylovorus]MDB6258917.1 hypothetical protein [Lactobacillus amylovorus]
MTKTYVKDYTNTFEIKGETIEVTAPARFDSKTNKIIDDMELDNRAIKWHKINIEKSSMLLVQMILKLYARNGT